MCGAADRAEDETEGGGHMIAWVACSTTGLDENRGHPLEVAFIVTDYDLVEHHSVNVVVRPVGVDIADVSMPLAIRETHEKSGLLTDVSAFGVRRYEAQELLIGRLSGVCGGTSRLRDTPLAAGGIGFERRWLRHHMPELESLFSPSSIDVNSLTELALHWAPWLVVGRPRSDNTARRAIDEVRESITLLRYYRERAFVGLSARCASDERAP